MDVTRERGVAFEAIYRLAKPAGRATLGKIVAIAHEDWRAEQPVVSASVEDSLPPNHYRVHMTYAPMPSFAELEKEFGENNVSVVFDGRPFSLHASCVGMDRTPGERIVYVHDAERDWWSEEMIAWGLAQRSAIAPNGYRPMTHEEEYEFAKAHPELVDFVGLGSSAMRADCWCVADVWWHDGQRLLGSDWFGRRWSRSGRVLFVCK